MSNTYYCTIKKSRGVLMTRLNDMVTYNGLCQTLQGETAAESEIIMPDYCPGILKLVKTEANSLVRSQSVRGDRCV